MTDNVQHKARILVADDEKSIANAIAAMIGMSDMQSIVVNDGAEANAALIGGEADAAIIDVMMPEMSGFDVLKAARSRGDKTPILMLTALTTIDDKMNGFESGADDYLPKPFDMRELIARISILSKQQPYSTGHMDIGNVTLNMSKSMIMNDSGTSLPMTDLETSIVSYLSAHRPAVRIGRLAEVASIAAGSEISDGAIELAAATATSKLHQLGSTVTISTDGDRLVIVDSSVVQDEPDGAHDDKASNEEPVNIDTATNAAKRKERHKTAFPWRIGR